MTLFFKVLFVLGAMNLAWRAFTYSHLVERTNRQNQAWLDRHWARNKDNNAAVADQHRRGMIVDYLVGAVCCALVAHFL